MVYGLFSHVLFFLWLATIIRLLEFIKFQWVNDLMLTASLRIIVHFARNPSNF